MSWLDYPTLHKQVSRCFQIGHPLEVLGLTRKLGADGKLIIVTWLKMVECWLKKNLEL